MVYIKGKFVSAEQVDKKGYKYLEVAVENEKSLKYPHLVKCQPDLDYTQLVDKNGIITLEGLYVSCWNDRDKKYGPKGINYSYSNKA